MGPVIKYIWRTPYRVTNWHSCKLMFCHYSNKCNTYLLFHTDMQSQEVTIFFYEYDIHNKKWRIHYWSIHHWRILWSSYRKLAWVRFEPTTTEFRSNTLTNWAIKPWVQLALRANFVQLLQFYLLFSVRSHLNN